MAPDASGAGRRVLVTGAAGFIGRALVAQLAARGWKVTGAVRSLPPVADRVPGVAYLPVGDLVEWCQAPQDPQDLQDYTHVVHAAARVHVMHGGTEAEFMRGNAEVTARLAERAAAAGVQRFVFLSSIKVNGEGTAERPYRHDDTPAPADAYARSKLAAEQVLWQACARSSLEGVVLRLPLVVGPGARANLARLVRLVERGLPLPFASIDNRRSLLSLDNLCDFVALALEHPQAAGRVWLLADGEDVTTADLVRLIATALGRPARLWPCPAGLLRALGAVTGRSAEVARLTGSLQVDSEPARRELGWRAPFTTGEGIAATLAGGSR